MFIPAKSSIQFEFKDKIIQNMQEFKNNIFHNHENFPRACILLMRIGSSRRRKWELPGTWERGHRRAALSQAWINHFLFKAHQNGLRNFF